MDGRKYPKKPLKKSKKEGEKMITIGEFFFKE